MKFKLLVAIWAGCLTLSTLVHSTVMNEGAGVQLFDPLLIVVNQSNTVYNLEWQDGTTDTMDNRLSFQVQNEGKVTIKPHTDQTIAAHFMSLTSDQKAPKKSNTLHITLYDNDHHKIAENRFVHNMSLQNCAVNLVDIKLIIDQHGIMTLVFDNATTGKK